MNFGNIIKKLRQDRKMTQKELADKLYVTDKTVSSWESNRTEPDIEMLLKLSKVLECNLNYLLNGEVKKDNIEMEIKVKIDKKEYDFLCNYMNSNATKLLESKQLDSYYICNNNGEFLRIRTSGDKNTLTYKSVKNNMYCDEYEVDIDNRDSLEIIFNLIRLSKKVEVCKERKTYRYLNKYEVALDNVKDLGYFVEIEVKKSIDDYLEEYRQLLNVARRLMIDLNNRVYMHYPQLMMDKK